MGRAEGTARSGRPALRAGVVGDPVAHSLSPAMHRAAYDVLGLSAEYEAFHLRQGELAGLLGRLGEDPGWRGLSVTMPHKADAAALADARSDRVELLGAANTLVVGHPDAPESGRFGPGLWAHNTDVDGIVFALSGRLPREGRGDVGSTPEGSGIVGGRVGVIGNGGTATAAVLAARLLGAAAVCVYARSAGRAAPVVRLAQDCGLSSEHRGLDGLDADLGDLSAVVSTLPPRAADPLAASLPGDIVPPVLLDVAYDPWPSALARVWAERGGRVVSGRTMLVGQGIEQVRLFTHCGPQERAQDWAAALAAMTRAVD